MSFTIRPVNPEDCETILSLIRELAVYEKMLDEVVATPEMIRESLFGDRPDAECLLAEVDGDCVGFALYFFNYSTFLGRQGLYLEDLFVQPEFRKQGIGKALFKKVAEVAVERNCGRMEWSVLDWNEPSIEFYKSMGAEAMEEWTVYRLTGERLKSINKIDSV
ncbi:GNAT family N-acetyltransferase [Rubinisphaera italica]|nr:GNAT family N-acetyltransferase [Rubinisphaera italica]